MNRKHLAVLALLGLAVYFLGNWGAVVTDPVESNYTETAKEMLAAGDWLSPRIYGNYWYDKPVFFYWELLIINKSSATIAHEIVLLPRCVHLCRKLKYVSQGAL